MLSGVLYEFIKGDTRSFQTIAQMKTALRIHYLTPWVSSGKFRAHGKGFRGPPPVIVVLYEYMRDPIISPLSL